MQTCDKIHVIPPSIQTPAIVGSYECLLKAWSSPSRFCNISTRPCQAFVVKLGGRGKYCILAASFDDRLTEVIYNEDVSSFSLKAPPWHDVVVRWYIDECLQPEMGD